jgi:hypothetical protein
MNGILKKYWIISMIVFFVAINFLGFYLIKTSPDFLDLYEHAESEEFIQKFKTKENIDSIFFGFLFILDSWLILFIPYLIIRKVLKTKILKSSKK